jgi:hypothetical protein
VRAGYISKIFRIWGEGGRKRHEPRQTTDKMERLTESELRIYFTCTLSENYGLFFTLIVPSVKFCLVRTH